MRHLLFALVLLVSAPAFAGSVDAVRQQVVNSLSVSGTIEIDAEGKVLRYGIAHPEAYTQGVRDLLARDIPHWTFAPVLIDGVPRVVRTDMYLQLRAKPIADGTFAVEIAGAAFGRDKDAAPGSGVSMRSMPPPAYPGTAHRAGVGAKVVGVLRIGRDGRVEEALVEQTNLRVVASERAMARWRKQFEDASLDAMRQWTFNPPTTGPEVDAPYWTLRVPIVFTSFTESGTPAAPGKWESYVPGPRRAVPWDKAPRADSTALDALPGLGVFPLHQDVQLLTRLGEG